jgi:hypothetical protein
MHDVYIDAGTRESKQHTSALGTLISLRRGDSSVHYEYVQHTQWLLNGRPGPS